MKVEFHDECVVLLRRYQYHGGLASPVLELFR